MVETDWRKILSLSEKELFQADKEELCESLSWMEADDIDLNFTDLKTLFRLSQDILKYKSEQVKNLMGELDTIQRKGGKKKARNGFMVTSSDSALETITHQEEVIKANKDILEQLYAEIAELEERKNKYNDESINMDKESDSTPDPISEMDAKARLENEIVQKNRHIRKLLGHIKILEEENTKFKDKISILKDKLKEATKIIEDFTEQMLASSNECNRLKESLGSSEHAKSALLDEISALKQEIHSKGIDNVNIHEDVKSKIQHLKSVVRSQRVHIENLSMENKKLKEDLTLENASGLSVANKTENKTEESSIKELGDKLIEASDEILRSANVIDILKAENKHLKSLIEETHDATDTDIKNESDDGKERKLANKLKKKIKNLTAALQSTEEMVILREKEVMELTSNLNILQTEEGVSTLLKAVKNKKQQLKIKDEEMKSLIKDINKINKVVDELQIENESMRKELNVSTHDKIPTEGILLEYHNLKQQNLMLNKQIQAIENQIVTIELENREQKAIISKYTKMFKENVTQKFKSDKEENGGKKKFEETLKEKNLIKQDSNDENRNMNKDLNIQILIEENEGLRKGLQEIFNFLKDNSGNSSGVLAFECPSLEAVLRSLEARHAAGWFAPHMATTLELKAALGGKDALLTALHQSRKEVFSLMAELSKESQKCAELQSKLLESESKLMKNSEIKNNNYIEYGEINALIFNNEHKGINLHNKHEIENVSLNRNSVYGQEVQNALIYFRNKYEILFNKMSEIAISTADERNKWLIQEENYKAQIESLKMLKISQDDEEASDVSPGLVTSSNSTFLERKCVYLEELYKNIRTSYENINNELLEQKKDKLISTAKFETQIQSLLIKILNLMEKISCSLPEELFWKQNVIFNETTIKYRQLVEANVKTEELHKLFARLEDNKRNAIDIVLQQIRNANVTKEEETNTVLKVETIVDQRQTQEICSELEIKNKQLEQLIKSNVELQELQAKLIDDTLASESKEEINNMKQNIIHLNEENKVLKEQYIDVQNKLDLVTLQLRDDDHKRLSRETEINMLRHQILDLQSSGDNKAVIAKLSNDILITQLQVLEYHKIIENLKHSLIKEKEMRINSEEALKAQQRIFDMATNKYENKFGYLHEVMQTLRLQYQGSLPLTSVEKYLNDLKELSKKSLDINEKLNEVEDLQYNLMTKHSVYDQILDLTKANCSDHLENCPHKLQSIVSLGTQTREVEHCKIKIRALEKSNEYLLGRCNVLDKTLVMINQGLKKSVSTHNVTEGQIIDVNNGIDNIKVEDVQSDSESSTKESGTFTIPQPRTTQLKNQIYYKNYEKKSVATSTNFHAGLQEFKNSEQVNVLVQTDSLSTQKTNQTIQTDKDNRSTELENRIYSLEVENKEKDKKLATCLSISEKHANNNALINEENKALHLKIQNITDANSKLIILNEHLHTTADQIQKQFDEFKNSHIEQCSKIKNKAKEEKQSLLLSIKKIENGKSNIVTEYKQLLEREREENYKNVKELQLKVVTLQGEMNKKKHTTDSANAEMIKESVAKNNFKIIELEDKCFKLQNNLEDYKTEIVNCQSELQRWKNLASERLEKMEQMSLQLKERHNNEVESYKAENQHWLVQLNENQREHMELRSQLTEQKALHVKQLSEKDVQIEQLRSVVNNLKTQIMNMQTMLSVQDPSFDLSAIVEVEEASDISQQGSDRLELKFDTTNDWHEMQDDFGKMTTSTTIWQEPVIERLRREKQLLSKQNGILRRQIKAIAARERRARLDAQNLKNQVFRISTSGSKAVSAESAALHNKIATLQAQLTSARRDAHSTVALWDKWKRAQQASERWQARYEEKCQEVNKLDATLHLTKSAAARLEKEKRVLMTRLSEAKSDKQFVREKQDGEATEKRSLSRSEYNSEMEAVPVSTRALIGRIEAQQRRIAALEVAEKGNEPLISEYEKALAEITSLKGQVLKLESTILETQIRSPIMTAPEIKPELEYWKSYCNMLKEENTQLILRVTSLENAPATAHQHRVNDLEQTILTLRGLVSKLQAEQKSSTSSMNTHRRVDSRPNSGHSATDKTRIQLESYRTEISNLKRTIQEKDALLERSKDMLRTVAEREDQLLNENSFLRRQLEELTNHKKGSLSA